MYGERIVRLTVDECPFIPGHTSLEHYAHFMLGYCAPIMAWLENSLAIPSGLVLTDCGPIMNKAFDFLLTSELGHIDLETGSGADAHGQWGVESVMLDRFDRMHLHKRESLLAARSFALRQLETRHACDEALAIAGKVIVVRRSKSPDYYWQGGGAQIPGYGTTRRAISNIEAIQDRLIYNGIDAVIFEPGAHRLECQVAAFSSAAGVVGQRGADLANCLWMTKSQFTVILSPREMASVAQLSAGICAAVGVPTAILPMVGLHGSADMDAVCSAVTGLAGAADFASADRTLPFEVRSA